MAAVLAVAGTVLDKALEPALEPVLERGVLGNLVPAMGLGLDMGVLDHPDHPGLDRGVLDHPGHLGVRHQGGIHGWH